MGVNDGRLTYKGFSKPREKGKKDKEAQKREARYLFRRQMACKSGTTTLWNQRLQTVKVGVN